MLADMPKRLRAFAPGKHPSILRSPALRTPADQRGIPVVSRPSPKVDLTIPAMLEIHSSTAGSPS
jgi:hypothetical protein